MRTRRLSFDRRIAALEASLEIRPDVNAKVVERANLPEWEKEILLRAVRGRLAVVSHEDFDRLNATLDALPPAERARINRATEDALIVAMSEPDLRL